jgi:hypothetical protein
VCLLARTGKRLDCGLAIGDRHQNPIGCRMNTTWMRPGCSWWISSSLPT